MRRCAITACGGLARAAALSLSFALAVTTAARAQEPFTDIGAGLTGDFGCSVVWGDYDADGDLDLAIAGANGGSNIYENDSGTFTDIDAPLVGVGYCSLAWGDCDNDSDLDLVLAGRGGTPRANIYSNSGGTFTDIGAGLTGVEYCAVAWADCDNDGDLDLAAAGERWGSPWYVGMVYHNQAGTFTDIGAGLTGVSSGSLAWGDYDNDGDLDLALAGSDITLNLITEVYRNDGGTFTDVGAELTGVNYCSLAWGDYDNDGDLDLALAGGTSISSPYDPVSKVYRNDGGTFTDMGAGLTGVYGCSLAWGDYDNDGDLDLALAGNDGSDYVSKLYRNDGGTFTDIGAGLTGVYDCSLAWGDYDGDGDLDLVLAGWTGSSPVSEVYRNNCGVANTIPSLCGALSGRASGGDVRFSWDAATDAETPQPGLTYNLRVGTTPGGNEIMSGMAVVGGADDGKRLIPAMGNVQQNTSWTVKGLAPGTYYWSVQAIDTAFAGSAWATEGTVLVEKAVTPFAGGCMPVASGLAGVTMIVLTVSLVFVRQRLRSGTR